MRWMGTTDEKSNECKAPKKMLRNEAVNGGEEDTNLWEEEMKVEADERL